jgi:hypothetical protein
LRGQPISTDGDNENEKSAAMKMSAPFIGVAAAAFLFAGCASAGDNHRPDLALVAGDYNGYYDDYYGAFTDGYWGADDSFYFSDGPGHAFRRDDAHHFRHDTANGFHTMHGHHEGGAPHEGGASHEGGPHN